MEGLEDQRQKRTRALGGGIAASVLLHLVAAFALFFHLPLPVSEPQKEESVTVELVPPPEQPEQKEEEPPPPQEEEEAKKEEPPPPPPPRPEEGAKKEEPPAEPTPPPAPQPREGEERAGQPMPVLRPVQQFGEEDAGPRIAEDGDAPEEPSGEQPEAPPTETAADTSEQASDTEAPEQAPPASAVPDGIEVPEVDAASNSHVEGIASGVASADKLRETVPEAVAKAEPQPAKTPAKDDAKPLTKATKLFSRSITESEAATTAMADIPRGLRAGQLCATELREQLRHAPAAYRPDVLPAYKLPTGTVLDIKQAAFRASAQWYNIKFRCEVDEEAMKVVSFAYDIGGAVPRNEWRSRGFPD